MVYIKTTTSCTNMAHQCRNGKKSTRHAAVIHCICKAFLHSLKVIPKTMCRYNYVHALDLLILAHAGMVHFITVITTLINAVT